MLNNSSASANRLLSNSDLSVKAFIEALLSKLEDSPESEALLSLDSDLLEILEARTRQNPVTQTASLPGRGSLINHRGSNLNADLLALMKLSFEGEKNFAFLPALATDSLKSYFETVKSLYESGQLVLDLSSSLYPAYQALVEGLSEVGTQA